VSANPGPGRVPEDIVILVVEDDLGLGELICELLAERGWSFVHRTSGAAALAWLEGARPTLTLLDYSLPDMTGVELVERAGLSRFIVTTGAGDERVAVEMMKKGALDYLVKDGMFLASLPEVVELALGHIGTEERLAEAEASLGRAEEDLVRARRMESLGLMAGGITHDFNNLFQGIQGNLEIALLQAPEGASRAPLQRAMRILDKATTQVQRMLEFSGKGFRQSEALSLNGLVDQQLPALAERAGRPVRFEGQAGLPDIEGDPQQLAQVLAALVRNAGEAIGAGPGDIRIITGEPGPDDRPGYWIHQPQPGRPEVCLTITDDGCGMRSEVLERAFEPFFTTRGQGRGLGLSTVLGILMAHGAGLWIATAPGRGTTVRIHFHPGAASGSLASPGAATSPAELPKRRIILLVDDDEDLQETLAEYLRDVLGYPVLQARDGIEAVQVFQREMEAVGLVLMDATMPRMTGPAAFQAMRAIDPGVRAILCSGFSEETGGRLAAEAGFLGYLKKPFLLKSLEATLAAVLE
jgi:signal transduction histidine kinase